MKRAYYERPARVRKGTKCYKCVWRHGSEEYLCDFATLAAPMTRGGVPPEKCRHFIEGDRIGSVRGLQAALKKLGREPCAASGR